MEWVVRIFSFLQLLLLKILQPFHRYRDRVRAPRVPSNDNPLLRLTASELARKIRHGEISSETVVKAYIERIKEVNPILNAVIEDRYEEAIKDARLCDKRLNSGEVAKAHLEVKMPLYGVPFTVKESCSLKGLSHTGCSVQRRGIKASADGPIVASMKKAGAIPLCVTNTPELCAGLDAANKLFGRTRNPYDGTRIAGGSSGGEGALLGAGASLIGIGSDIAGSIRIPALFNGIFGHKPTPGIIPITCHYPIADDEVFHKYLVTGPMARYMDDLMLAMRVMSGEHTQKLRLDETIDISKLKIYWREDAAKSFGVEPVDEAIRKSIRKAASHLQSCGAKVSDPPVGPLHEAVEISISMFFDMPKMPQLLLNPSDPKNECSPFVEAAKALFGMSEYTNTAIFMTVLKDAKGFVPLAGRIAAKKRAHPLREKFLEILSDDGVFLWPTFTTPAPAVGEIVFQSISGLYCLLVNVFGFPSTHVTMGLNEKGLPIGFQVIAAPNQDRLCLAVAKELEKRFGGWVEPPTC